MRTKTLVLIPYPAAKTERWRNFCRKDEGCDSVNRRVRPEERASKRERERVRE